VSWRQIKDAIFENGAHPPLTELTEGGLLSVLSVPPRVPLENSGLLSVLSVPPRVPLENSRSVAVSTAPLVFDGVEVPGVWLECMADGSVAVVCDATCALLKFHGVEDYLPAGKKQRKPGAEFGLDAKGQFKQSTTYKR
jgi:hypothetical protein